jgi:hypothetical protein
MKHTLVAVTLVLALGSAGSAQAKTCGCVLFARDFLANRGNSQLIFNHEAKVQGIGVRSRLGIRKGIYDWNRTRDFKTPFCQRNKAICTAVAACLAAAGATVANDLTVGPP